MKLNKAVGSSHTEDATGKGERSRNISEAVHETYFYVNEAIPETDGWLLVKFKLEQVFFNSRSPLSSICLFLSISGTFCIRYKARIFLFLANFKTEI